MNEEEWKTIYDVQVYVTFVLILWKIQLLIFKVVLVKNEFRLYYGWISFSNQYSE